MDTELLKTFLEVQKTRHFGKAAENLYLTQSAVSFRIRQLEQSLGVPLFNRFRNNIQLTVAGEMLLLHAQAVLSAIHSAKQQIHQNSHPQSRLQLLISSELSGLFQSALLSELLLSFPQPHLQFLSNALLSRHQPKDEQLLILFGQQPAEPPQGFFLGTVEFWPVQAADGQHQQEGGLEGSIDRLKLPRLGTHALSLECNDAGVLLNWLLDNRGCAYLPAPQVQALLQAQKLQRLTQDVVCLPVWAYGVNQQRHALVIV